MAYEKTVWVDDSEPAINAANLNKIETGVADVDSRVEELETAPAPAWGDITGKPTIPAATATGTRAQLDAGTDNTPRAFTAKDINEFVAAAIAAAATPAGE